MAGEVDSDRQSGRALTLNWIESDADHIDALVSIR
jgi:hypothetical protein